jgi:hypothetical protein
MKTTTNFREPRCTVSAMALLLVLAFLFMGAFQVAAQGTVTFANEDSSKVMLGTNARPATLADNLLAALYWAPMGSNNFTQLGDAVRVGTPGPGLFFGGTRLTGPGTPGGDPAQFQVRIWDAQYPSFEQALLQPGARVGRSGVLTNPTGNPAASPPFPPPCSLMIGGLSGAVVASGGAIPGDFNGDGIVDATELNAVLLGYWAHSPQLVLTNATKLSDGRFQFALTNLNALNFTVLVSTNMVDWTRLPGQAHPVFQLLDPDADSKNPARFYRLQAPY